MNKSLPNPFRFKPVLRLLVTLCTLLLTHGFVWAASVVVYVDDQGGLFGFSRPEVNDPASALVALATPPSAAEAGRKLSSGVLPGTKVLALWTEGDTTIVDFSVEIIGSGLDEVRLTVIFQQVKATLRQFGVTGSVRLQAAGKLLSDYLPPVKRVEPNPSAKVITPNVTGALASKTIALSPGHGWFWNGSGWYTQRPVYCAPLSQEDFHNCEEVMYLNTYLTQDGATTKPYRCLDKSYGNHSTGHPWWQMAAYLWVQNLGYPCSVYANYTGDCATGSGGDEGSDDVRARPLASDYDSTDIYVALHSNGYTGDCTGSCPTGTETYYDATSPQPGPSQTLATAINAAVLAAITGNADSSWTCHGTCVKNSNGSYGEIRIPNRPASLTELAYHDTCDRDADANHLQDNFFRSTATWGMYKGICDYFGVAPTWAYYSDELVSHDIPASMDAGATATVHITFRNRGVLWNDARGFQLGAVGDSDPFTATTRYNVGGEVGPNTTKTFTVSLTAPTTAGTYTTDWRMLRSGVAWFGDTLTVNIVVNAAAGAPSITTQPVSQSVRPGDTVNFTVVAAGNAPLSYQWRRNGVGLTDGGNVSGAATAALTITGAQPANAGTYTVFVSNPNGSVLSAEAVLTVNAYPATWGPYNLTTSRCIYSPSYQGTSLRTGWYTTTAGTGAARSVLKAADSYMASMPDATLVSGSTFTVAFTQSGTYSTSADNPLNIYRIGQTWDTSAVWDSPWSGGGNYSSVGTSAQSVVYPATGTLYTFSPGAGYNFPYGVMMKGNTESSITYRKSWLASGPYPTLSVSYATPGPTIRSWAYLGHYAQGVTADHVTRINTDHVSGIYGGVTLDESTIAPGAADGSAGYSYGNSYGTYKWANATAAADIVDLLSAPFYSAATKDNGTTYAAVYVYYNAATKSDVYMGVGSDDDCKVYLNGALVGSFLGTGRGAAADNDYYGPMTLNNGWNRLLVKVENGGGGYGLYARFANANRSALANVTTYVKDATAPSAPTSLAVSGVTSGVWQNTVAAPTFTWTSGTDSQGTGEGVSGVRGQKYYFGTDSGGSPNAFQTGSSYAPGAQADGTYYFKVDTVDYALNESGAAAFTFMYDGTAPTAITAFGSASPGGSDTDWYNSTGDLTWTWTAATDATSGLDGYAVVQDQIAGTQPGTTKTSDATTVSYSLTGPQASGEYWLHVRSKDVAGNWLAAANTAHRRIRIDRTAPTGVSLGFGTITTDSITVTGSGTDAHSGINASTGYNYSRTGASDSGAKGITHTWTGLDANTQYGGFLVTVSDQAVPTPNTTASAPQSQWTLSVAPTAGSVTPDDPSPTYGGTNTWTAVGGFGAGKVQYYRYAFDESALYTWTDTEPQWSSGTLATVPASAGDWYLHVKGYNGADVGNGTYDYALTVQSGVVYSQTNAVASMEDNGDGTFTLSFVGTPQAQYYVVTCPDPGALAPDWQVLPNSTNTAPSPGGVWSVTVTNDNAQRFYRSAAVNPAP